MNVIHIIYCVIIGENIFYIKRGLHKNSQLEKDSGITMGNRLIGGSV